MASPEEVSALRRSWRPHPKSGIIVPKETRRVVAAVVLRDARILICQRPSHKRYGGLWEFPGGKVEAGETDFEALQRELREELRLEVTQSGPECLVVNDSGAEFEIAFIAVGAIGEPIPNEHQAVAWVLCEELTSYNLAPSDRSFAEHLRRSLSQTSSPKVCQP